MLTRAVIRIITMSGSSSERQRLPLLLPLHFDARKLGEEDDEDEDTAADDLDIDMKRKRRPADVEYATAGFFAASNSTLTVVAMWGLPGGIMTMDTLQDLDPEVHLKVALNVNLLNRRSLKLLNRKRRALRRELADARTKECLGSRYTLRVRILGTTPSIWRELEVSGLFPLHHLHSLLATYFGWALLYHQYLFVLPDGIQSTHDFKNTVDGVFTFGFPALDAMHVRLGQVIKEVGEKFHYIYDLGIGWVHEIEVVKVAKLSSSSKATASDLLPVCLAGERAGPPEDAESIGAFEDLPKQLRDPKDRSHKEKIEWIGSATNIPSNWASVKSVPDYKSRSRLTDLECEKVVLDMATRNQDMYEERIKETRARRVARAAIQKAKGTGTATAPKQNSSSNASKGKDAKAKKQQQPSSKDPEKLWDFVTFDPPVVTKNFLLALDDEDLLPLPLAEDLDPEKAELCPVTALPIGIAFREQAFAARVKFPSGNHFDKMAFCLETLRRNTLRMKSMPLELKKQMARMQHMQVSGGNPDPQILANIENMTDPEPLEWSPPRFPQARYELSRCAHCKKEEGRTLGKITKDGTNGLGVRQGKDIDRIEYEIIETKMMRCSRCRKEYYCSAECQKAGWKTHKAVCVPKEK